MENWINPEHYTVGTKVRIPARHGADGVQYPAIDTVVTRAPWRNASGIWVCLVAHWGNASVRVDNLELLNA